MNSVKFAKQLLEKFRVYPENIKEIAIEKDRRFLGNYRLWISIDNWKEQYRPSPFIMLLEFSIYEGAEEIALAIEFNIVPDRKKIKTFYCQK